MPTEDRTLAIEKRKLREVMLARRRGIPHAAMVRAGESAARHYADHPILAFAASFAAYRPMRGEVDVLPLFHLMGRYRKMGTLPAMTAEKTLLFRAWEPGDPLVRHPLGVEEPAASAPALVPEVVLVPLLAFDGDGYRLGYGGGYYDRTIAALREGGAGRAPLFIGVAHSAQEVEAVPNGAHDMRLDGILTELGVSMFFA